jgi:hypothetical protein
MASEHDNAVDKVLAALRAAAPPEGMEARVAQRLAQTLATPAAQPLLRRLRPNSPFAAWWSGALTGAVVAALAVCSVFLLVKRHPSVNDRQEAAAPSSIQRNGTSPATFSLTQSAPCPDATPRLRPAMTVLPKPRLLVESPPERTTSLHTAPSAPLTPQERELVRLASLGGPRELTAASPDTLARVQEQEAAEFNKFFTPPTPPATADNE